MYTTEKAEQLVSSPKPHMIYQQRALCALPPPSSHKINEKIITQSIDEWADKPWTLLVSELAVPFSVIFIDPIDLVISFSYCVIWSMQACLYLSWLSASCCCNSSIVVLILSSMACLLTGTIVSDSCITHNKHSLLLKINKNCVHWTNLTIQAALCYLGLHVARTVNLH